MENRLFLEKAVRPDRANFAAALGKSFVYWQELFETLNKQYGPLVEEWKYYGGKSGWTLKVLCKKRNLFFLKPFDNFFRIVFAFGDKAVDEIMMSDFPPQIAEELRNAVKYAEGRGLRLDIKKKIDIQNVIKLVAVKLNN
jgi:Protein of unknown function (DUF3788)